MGATPPTLPPFEVAVRGRSAALPGLQHIVVHAQAHRTPRIAPLESRVQEDAVQAFFFRGTFHGGRTGARIGLESVTVEGGRTSTLDLQTRERLNVASWSEAVDLIMSGEVEQVAQTHSLEVTLFLKDGSRLDTIEPQIDEVFTEIEKCGVLCSEIVMITE